MILTFGGTIPRKKKTEEANTAPETPVKEPESTGRPMVFLAGLAALFIGLFIALGSLVHNNLKVLVTDTSHAVYGPWDWTAAIIGAIALLVGIILLFFSRSSSSPA